MSYIIHMLLGDTCGIWVEFGNLSITEKLAFRSYTNSIIHNVSFSIHGLVMEMLLCKGIRCERAAEARHLIPKGQQKGMRSGRVILPEEGPAWNPAVIFVWLALDDVSLWSLRKSQQEGRWWLGLR